MTFNFNQFHTVLYNECKIAFPKIIDQLSHENIYAIALYTKYCFLLFQQYWVLNTNGELNMVIRV
jgi:hypothetical protein